MLQAILARLLKNLTMKQRDSYIDVAKGLAMLFIIRIHTECMGPLGVPYPIIAVPFFFFLSGMYDKSERPFFEWLPKTFKSLIVTGFIWNTIGYLYKMGLQYLKDGNPDWQCILEWPFSGDGTVWFLAVLFATKLLLALIIKIPLPRLLLLAFVVGIAWISSIVHPYAWIDKVLTALPLYYAGKLLYPHLNQVIENKTLNIIGLACIIYIWLQPFPYTLVEMSIDMDGLLYPAYLMMTFMAFVPCLYASKKLQSWKWMANYGTKTLGTLVLHPLMLHTCAIVLNRLFIPESVLWFTTFIIAYIVVCILCYYITLYIEHYCPVLLGKF